MIIINIHVLKYVLYVPKCQRCHDSLHGTEPVISVPSRLTKSDFTIRPSICQMALCMTFFRQNYEFNYDSVIISASSVNLDLSIKSHFHH